MISQAGLKTPHISSVTTAQTAASTQTEGVRFSGASPVRPMYSDVLQTFSQLQQEPDAGARGKKTLELASNLREHHMQDRLVNGDNFGDATTHLKEGASRGLSVRAQKSLANIDQGIVQVKTRGVDQLVSDLKSGSSLSMHEAKRDLAKGVANLAQVVNQMTVSKFDPFMPFHNSEHTASVTSTGSLIVEKALNAALGYAEQSDAPDADKQALQEMLAVVPFRASATASAHDTKFGFGEDTTYRAPAGMGADQSEGMSFAQHKVLLSDIFTAIESHELNSNEQATVGAVKEDFLSGHALNVQQRAIESTVPGFRLVKQDDMVIGGTAINGSDGARLVETLREFPYDAVEILSTPLADLGDSLSNPDLFVRLGLGLAQEMPGLPGKSYDREDISNALERVANPSDRSLSASEQNGLDCLKHWSKGQPGFAIGRQQQAVSFVKTVIDELNSDNVKDLQHASLLQGLASTMIDLHFHASTGDMGDIAKLC